MLAVWGGRVVILLCGYHVALRRAGAGRTAALFVGEDVVCWARPRAGRGSILGTERQLCAGVSGSRFANVRYLWLNRAGLRELDGISSLPMLEELYVGGGRGRGVTAITSGPFLCGGGLVITAHF